jgi:hypothetical protein
MAADEVFSCVAGYSRINVRRLGSQYTRTPASHACWSKTRAHCGSGWNPGSLRRQATSRRSW